MRSNSNLIAKVFSVLVVALAATLAIGRADWPLQGGGGGGAPTTRSINTSSPLNGGGDLSVDRTIGIANQNSNVVLAGPSSGAAGAPTFRSLVPADIPDLSAVYQTVGGGGGGGVSNFFYGDGSDGALHFDGSTTILGIVPSGNVYTLTKNVFASSITLDSGVTIKTSQYVICCSGTFTFNGVLNDDGTNASGTTGGASLGGILQQQTFGGFGTTAANGNFTTGGGVGGVFGGGSGGSGGSAGVAGQPGATQSISAGGALLARTGEFWALTVLLSNTTTGFYSNIDSAFSQPNRNGTWTGGGGGNGCGDGASNSGAGGGAGGIILVRAKTLAVGAAASVSAKGGNGSNSAGGNACGGAGGGGGVGMFQCGTYSGTALTTAGGSPNVVLTGGTHGTGTGTGGNGGDGGTGTLWLMTNQ